MNKLQSNKIKSKKVRKKWFLNLTILFLVGVIVGWFWLDRWSKKHGFSGAGDFTRTIVSNYWDSFDARYETAEITISGNDFDKLANQREEHLRKGLITKVDNRYVPGIITFKGKKIKCRLRLKGHMTDHLQDKKWSFRIKTVSGDAFNGMKIFSLQHPGTRNYIYEWIYHQLLEQEGIATVRYSFLNLKVNGESWGIYALEENFAEELISHHRLPNGPILGFNPDMYWFARLNEHENKSVNYDDYRFNSTYAEAYDENESFSSSEKRKDYSEAVTRLYLFASGQLSTSEVFDIDKLARFHAIIDLVGGHFSLDWSDVKYYYNPQSHKIEPVGYESFSVQNTKYLSGAFRFKNNQAKLPELHDLIFSDPKFFKLYVKHLKRISKSDYLDDFFNKKERQLKNNLNILYSEFPYKKLPLDGYYRNQDNIKTLLGEPVTNVCYLESVKNDSIRLTIGNTGSLPLEILGLKYQDSLINFAASFYSSARRKNEIIGYESLLIPFKKIAGFKEKDLSLMVKKMGNSEKVEIAIKPIEFFDQMEKYAKPVKSNVGDFDFLAVDDETKVIRIAPGEHRIEKDMIFPEGYVVLGVAPLKLILDNNSRIWSGSSFKITGTEDAPVEIVSMDSTGGGIVFTSTQLVSRFSYVYFLNLSMKTPKGETHNGMISFYESSAHFDNCIFSSKADWALSTVRAVVNLSNCEFLNFNSGIKMDYSNLNSNNCSFSKINSTAIELVGSFGTINGTTISASDTGLKIKDASMVKGKNLAVDNSSTGVDATDLSILQLDIVSMSNVETGFVAEKKSDVFGPAKIFVKHFKSNEVKTVKATDKNSRVEIK